MSVNNPHDETGTISAHYNIQHRDVVTMVATISGEVAYRNMMIPMFAEHLKNSKGDIYQTFLRTHNQLKIEIPEQIPEFRSTLTHRLSLKNIFKPESWDVSGYSSSTSNE